MRASGKVIHVAPTVHSPFANVPGNVQDICRELVALHWDTEIVTVGEPEETGDQVYRLNKFPNALARAPVLSKLCASPALKRWLHKKARQADVLHTHGLWILPGAYASGAARRFGKPYVMSTRGMLGLEALRFGVLQKRIFWLINERASLHGAACLHAENEREYEDIRSLGIKVPVAVISQGVAPPLPTAAQRTQGGERILLSLGRLHPIKGLDCLIAAWARIETRHPHWRLQIAGNSEASYEAKLRNLAAALGIRRIDFLGPRIGQDKAETFASASLFALPSLGESFAATVIEALSYGVPVIASKGTPWKVLPERGCGWWIEHGVEPLADALSHAMSLPHEELEGMGERGRHWATGNTWHSTGKRLVAVYQWLKGEASAPADVQLK